LRLDELNAEAENPNLWDDPDQAQRVMRERNHLEQSLATYSALEQELEDGWTLAELGDAEGDDESLDEAQKMLDAVKARAAKMQLASLLSGEADGNDCYLEVHAGAGGTESQDWAQMLLRMYIRWAEQRGFKAEMIGSSEGEEVGIKSATLLIQGHNAYGWIKTESGVHRLVRISPFDSNARRHTSFASVWAFPVIDDSIDIEIEEKDVRIDTYRASGAGGQHVNKTDSAIRLTHLPTGVVVECQDERSQHKNRARAMSLLKAKLLQSERDKITAEQAQNRRNLIGSGDRSERIRTYNYPQGRVTDNRINLTLYKLAEVTEGELDLIIEPLLQEHHANLMADLAAD